MSKENVETVRQFLDKWIEVDEGLADLDELRAFVGPTATFDTGGMFPSEAVGKSQLNIDEFIEFRAAFAEPYDDWSYELKELHDAGNRVVATFRQRGKPRGSDSWVEMHYGIGYMVEGGSITGAKFYATSQEALEAAGVRK